MSTSIHRRTLLRRSAAAALALAAPLGAPSILRAGAPAKVSLGGMSNGWSLMATTLMKERGFDTRHGVEVETKFYPTLSIYYADYIAGRIDVAMGAWDFFAAQYLKGAPIRLLGSVSTYSMAGFLVGPDGPKTVEGLKGKSVAALQGGGLYSLTKATLKKFSNIELGTDVPVQNIQNINAGITLVAANRADATLVWEPGLATGLQKIPGSRVMVTINDYLIKHVGREGPYFALSVQKAAIDRDPSVAKRLEDVYRDLFAHIAANPGEFAEMGKVQDLDPAIMKAALDSGRLKLALRPAREKKNREDMQFFADLLTETGALPGKLDAGFFVG